MERGPRHTGTHMPYCTHGGCVVSSPLPLWVPGIEPQLLGLYGKHFYPLSQPEMHYISSNFISSRKCVLPSSELCNIESNKQI